MLHLEYLYKLVSYLGPMVETFKDWETEYSGLKAWWEIVEQKWLHFGGKFKGKVEEEMQGRKNITEDL